MIESLKSFLFVPGDNPDRIQKAAGSKADAVIVDLEDSVATGAKDIALVGLNDAHAVLKSAGKACVVRINADPPGTESELRAACECGFDAVMLPKVESPARIEQASALIAHHNPGRGQIPPTIIALVESACGILAAPQITAAVGVSALALGTEDFSLDMGTRPTPDLLDLPVRQIALAARAHRLAALALPLSIAEFRDAEKVSEAAKKAAGLGCTGALCIHPNQVEAVNSAFSPAPADIDEARAILAAWGQSQSLGVAVAQLDSMMIDAPVVARARLTLTRAGEIS